MAAATETKKETISVDEQFLLDYVARGGKVEVIASGQELDKENVDEFLRQQTKAADKKTKLQERAEKLKAADDERLEREKQKEEQKRAATLENEQEREEQKRLSESQRMRKALGNAATKFGDSVQPALDRISSLHTVGGIGLLVFILMILVFTVVQVNPQGDTRLKLIWAMLNGNAHLIGRAQVGGQASGNFGPGAQPNGASGNFGTPTPGIQPALPSSNGSAFRQFTGNF